MTEWCFSVKALEQSDERDKLKKQLRNRSWRLKVVTADTKTYFLQHCKFKEQIRLPRTLVPDTCVLKPGMEIQAMVTMGLNPSSGIWFFTARPIDQDFLSKPFLPAGMPEDETVRRERAHHKSEVSKRKRASRSGASDLIRRKNLLNEIKSLAVPAVVPFSPQSGHINIYIDEAWSLGKELGIARNTGVIAGIVWDGSDVAYELLPHIGTHLRKDSLLTPLRNLLACPQAFPFLMPIQVADEQATQTQYFELVCTALKVVLGWLLPQDGHDCTVSVFLERIEKFEPGMDLTDYFRGVFHEACNAGSGRFRRWHLGEVSWREKDFGYIPYADLIGYLCHEHIENCYELGAAAGYRQWPGYLPMSLTILPALSRIDLLESGLYCDELFNFLTETDGTVLCRTVKTYLSSQIQQRPELRRQMVETLEENYASKQRNLVRLRRLMGLVREMVGVMDGAPPRLRLVWTLLGLQNANHDGDPVRCTELIAQFMLERAGLLELDRELVLSIDLNYVVHLNDMFRFSEASDYVDRLLAEPWIAYLPPLLKGKLYSTQGQCRSLCGDHHGAEKSYVQALQEFCRQHELGEPSPGDVDQTRVYRAINGLDANFSNAHDLLVQALGDLDVVVGKLVADTSMKEPYHHHLLLRALWFREDLSDTLSCYLQQMESWKDGWQHPWEMIQLYRALLLLRSLQQSDSVDAKAQDCFDQALEVVQLKDHGPTIRLIGAMVATVAHCCFECANSEGYDVTARRYLQMVAKELPASYGMVRRMEELLEQGEVGQINEILKILPFNYH